MSDEFVSVNLTKLRAMKADWAGVVGDRGAALAKIKDRLHQHETVPKGMVIEFYDAILEFGRAGGRVDMLESLIVDLAKSTPVQEPGPGLGDGSFRLG